ncbi:hypothetical protein GURASL_34250 [Geotalea uraniireducens]|uniref:histidine kinase n=1 Tax=Geotalea uraniireducens TaxID=351604 RepID=A0ABM8EPW9_9BACT|nr:PocR ligand-binding domain-containing protein [Geotalea uraniireducens]BDV44502.1 hypothetical protein GURASL_34250 [Geotalea uraniireducens]
MAYRFTDLVDMPRLRDLMERFCQISGMPVGIVTPDGEILVASEWQEICVEFHRVHPELAERCLESNLHIKGHLREGEYFQHKCLNGLWDVGIPIVIGGEVSAMLIAGQFFYDDERPDVAFFRDQARRFGLDEAGYLAALERVPVFSREKVRSVMEYSAGLVGLLADTGVARLRQLEVDQALRESEQRVRLLLNSTAEAIYGLDMAGNCIFCNPACLRFLGYEDESRLLGQQMHQLIHHTRVNGSHFPREECHVNRAFLYGEAVHVQDDVFWCADDKPLPVEYWSHPVRRDGEVIGAVVTFLDITERKRAEEALRSSEEKFARAFRTAPIMIAITTLDEGRLIEVNDTFERSFGYLRDQAIGRTTLQLNLWQNPAERLWFARLLREEGAVRELEFNFRHRSGRIFMGLLSAEVIGINGQQCVLTLVNDVTERKRAQGRIELLNASLAARAAELETVNRELEAFSYSLSHDLRSLLGQIDLSAQVLHHQCGTCLDDTGTMLVDVILETSNKMEQLIEAMLVLSRVSGKEMEQRTVDLSMLANEILLSHQAAAPERPADIFVAPGLQAVGDSQLLRVVLDNLLGNAWKYTEKVPRRRIEVGMECQSGEQVFFVRDNGIGFDRTAAADIFKPFQRLHNSAEYPGTGIGLATVQRIILRHGGRVWAEGKAGEGATFYFTLPAVREPMNGAGC